MDLESMVSRERKKNIDDHEKVQQAIRKNPWNICYANEKRKNSKEGNIERM